MPGLVGDHDSRHAAALSRPHRLRGAGKQADLVGVPEIVDVLDQGAVAIEEDRRPAGSLPERLRQGAADLGGRRPRAACAGRAARGLRPPERRRTGSPRRSRSASPSAPSGPGSRLTRVVGSTAPGNEPPPTADSPAWTDGVAARRGHSAASRSARAARSVASSVSMRSTGISRTALSVSSYSASVASRAASVSLSARMARASGFSPAARDQRTAPHEAAGLRATEQLVAAEEHEAGAGGRARRPPAARSRGPTGSGPPAGRCPRRTGRGRPPPSRAPRAPPAPATRRSRAARSSTDGP